MNTQYKQSEKILFDVACAFVRMSQKHYEFFVYNAFMNTWYNQKKIYTTRTRAHVFMHAWRSMRRTALR